MSSFLRRPSPAMIVALAALFISLSGNPLAKGAAARTARAPVTGIQVRAVKSGGGEIPADSADQGEARCPHGFFVISGGWEYTDSVTITTTLSAPATDAEGWIVHAANPPLGQSGHGYVVAYCGKFGR
jgi:hypothetical protein